MLYELIKDDLKKSMKEKDWTKSSTLRVIIGEVQRLNKKVNEKVKDIEVVKILNRLIKSEKIVLEYSGLDEHTSPYIETLISYLPKTLNENEIVGWIRDNIDIDSYDNKIKAMGDIMPILKPMGVDGNVVKKILVAM